MERPDNEHLGLTRGSIVYLRADHWAVIELIADPGPEKASSLAWGLTWDVKDWWDRFPATRVLCDGNFDEYIQALVYGMVYRRRHPPAIIDAQSWTDHALIGHERATASFEQRVLREPDDAGDPLLTENEGVLLHLVLRVPDLAMSAAAVIMGCTTKAAQEIAQSLETKLLGLDWNH